MKKLGVNIDHIATLRNARGEDHPNILFAAKYAYKKGTTLKEEAVRLNYITEKEFDILVDPKKMCNL